MLEEQLPEDLHEISHECQLNTYDKAQAVVEKLSSSYPNNLLPVSFQPSGVSTAQFTKHAADHLAQCNKAYQDRNLKGIFYENDFITENQLHNCYTSAIRITNVNYWNLQGEYFTAKADKSASDALQAYFQGITINDCGMTLAACMYRSIEQMVGSAKLNQQFDPRFRPLVITPYLYNLVEVDGVRLVSTVSHSLDYRSNPLFFMFDMPFSPNQAINEDNIMIGDIVHIAGVKNYAKKHPDGAAGGWNVICVGENSAQEKLYLGFGPNEFTEPLTYTQIRQLLIDAYNAPHCDKTAYYIEHYRQYWQAGIETYGCDRAYVIAEQNQFDCVSQDYQIGGIEAVIRLNPSKLQAFFSSSSKHWHTQDIEDLQQHAHCSDSPGKILFSTQFSMESKTKDFGTYQVETEHQDEIFGICKKFALALSPNMTVPIGLELAGAAGVGKTHLSVAIAKQASQQGLNVRFIDANTVSNMYQDFSIKMGPGLGRQKATECYQALIKDVDLIILDDINTNRGVNADFLSLAFKYICENNKAILVSSNHQHYFLRNQLATQFESSDVINNNFLFHHCSQLNSIRAPWWQGLINSSDSLVNNQQKLDVLMSFENEQAAGIILEQENLGLETLNQSLIEKYSLSADQIRIVGDGLLPSKTVNNYELYFIGDFSHDIFLIKFERYEASQILNLVAKVHDHGKKMIVLTENKKYLIEQLHKQIQYDAYNKQGIRIKDRLRCVLI